MNVNLIAHVRDHSKSTSLWKRERSWQVTKTDVAGNCAAINLISFSYNFLCLSLQLNFSITILCVAQITLQWNNKNLLKRPSQTWLWKGYMTSCKETVLVKRIQVVDCIQSCLSRHELLLIWRKNTQNRVDLKTKNILIFGDEFSKYLPSLIFSYSNLIHSVLQGWFPLGIGQ